MNIVKINRIKNYRSFNNFSWNGGLPDFARYNLIYGWNGTGKTTLSDIFRNIEKKEVPPDGEFSFNISNGQKTTSINSNDIANSQSTNIPNVRVFNKGYVEENIFVASGNITPIYVLGEENVDKQKEVNSLKSSVSESEEKLAGIGNQKKETVKAIDKHQSEGAQHIKDTLRSPGDNVYNNYDKRDYKRTIEKILKKEIADSYKLDEHERKNLIDKTNTPPKTTLTLPEINVSDIKSIYAGVEEICSKTITSEVIEILRQHEKLADWVRTGLGLHKDGDYKDCQFCNQPLPSLRIPQLENHFNDDYVKLMEDIDAQYHNIKNCINNIENISLPRRDDLDVTLQECFEKKVSAFNSKRNNLIKFLEEIRLLLEEKKGKPFVVVSCDLSVPEEINEEVLKIESVIQKHNEVIENHNEIVSDSRSKIERSIIADNYDSYNELKGNLSKLETEEVSITDEVRKDKSNILRIESEIRETRRPAEEINKDLASYLGHGELKFEIEETGYKISRSGYPAKNISEGEKTAIALLYFLKSLEDTSFTLGEGIVVIDDPVSSMDESSLFYAFGFIKEKTKDAGQLFILTHNFTLFRQINKWFKYLKGDSNSVSQYQMFVTKENGKRNSGIKPADKLLIGYESEYYYLFSIISKNAFTDSTSLKENYHLPNVARRVLECFFAFKYPSKSNGFYATLKQTSPSFEQSKRTRIERFLNVHSHENHIGVPEHDSSILAETPEILKNVLELIKLEDAKHYKGMEELLKTTE